VLSSNTRENPQKKGGTAPSSPISISENNGKEGLYAYI
jgi:hypothetical protein